LVQFLRAKSKIRWAGERGFHAFKIKKKNERKMHEIKQGTPNMIFHMTQKQTEDFFHSSIMHEMKIRNFKLEKKEILPNAIVVH